MPEETKKTFRQYGNTAEKSCYHQNMGAHPARLSEDNRDVDKAACNYSLFTREVLYHREIKKARENSQIFREKESGTWNICQMELKERSSAAVMAFTSVVTAGISVAEALITAGILSTVRGTAGVLAG